jgi:putative hemolysin
MGGVALELAIIAGLVLVNGALAASEIAVVTSRKTRLRRRAAEGDGRAAAALELAEHPNRFLSTVQIGITAVAVVAGAFGGARVARSLAPGLVSLGLSPAWANQLAIVLVVLGITYVTLVVGELVPKRLALHDPERLAGRIARPMHRLSRVATPLVRLLSGSTELVLKLFRLEDRQAEEVTEDEIRGMIAHATETGVLEPTEQLIVERLFRLSDRTLGSLMTPREAVVWVERDAPLDVWRERLGDVRHTRYIVARGSLDRHAGYVNVRDLLRQSLRDGGLDVERAIRSPHVLPEWTPAFQLLDLFQRSGDHLALVTDGHNRVTGLVTLNDLMEGIVGDLPEARDEVSPGVIQREDGSWLVDGLLGFDEFASVFDVSDTVEEEYGTLHAFMVARLHGRPAAAAVVKWAGLRLEVVDMDGSRVDKVLVSRLT